MSVNVMNKCNNASLTVHYLIDTLGSMLPVHIETSRLVLRPVAREDWQFLLSSVTHPAFPEELTLTTFGTPRLARSWINFCVDCWTTQKRFVWTMLGKDEQQTIGQITMAQRQGQWVLSYWLAPPYWNHGFAVEGCQGVLQAIRPSLKTPTLLAAAALWNKASQRVLTKLGFRPAGSRQIRLMNGRLEEVIDFELPEFSPVTVETA